VAETILVIAAHPDDEILGCGGTIARHAAAGNRCHSLILGEGATSRDTSRDPESRSEELNALREAAAEAASVLGAQSPRFAELPDNRFDTIPLLDIVKQIERVIDELSPSIIYTHHPGDLNIDHQIACRAVLTACRPLPGSSVQRVDTFETVSSTEWAGSDSSFVPTCYVDILEQMETKVAALQSYCSEMREFPHARSIENVRALAACRGASVGLEAAEAFAILREIVK